jgi:PncC family amidohydrolase
LDKLRTRHQTLATAESCTGGLIGKCLTDIPGSSQVYRGGIIAYHNDIKQNLLGVDPQILNDKGAVSEETVLAMANGVRKLCGTSWGIAVSGIAGPDGGSPEKPVGLVWAAICSDDCVKTFQFEFPGDRETIRDRSVVTILNNLFQLLQIPVGTENKNTGT